jgi:glycosyltransferase involved in cell wall biosynthesis
MLTLDNPSQSKAAAVDAHAPTVCQLVHGLPVGGAEVLVCRMIRRLRDRYRFVVACLDQVGELGESLTQEGIDVVQLGRQPGFDWRCVRRLREFCADRQVSVIHAHQYTPFAYAIATRAYGRRPPVLFTEHGRFYPDYPSYKRKIFNRLIANKRDRFVAVGQSVRQALIDNEGLPSDRIEVVYNGIDAAAFGHDEATRRDARQELGLQDEFAVVQVARLDTIKDHATAVRAIAIASKQNPRLRLLIVGDGPQRESIERLVAELNLADRVQMLGMRSDVCRLLAAADAFLLTSLSEGIPVTLIEAMAAGVPIVSTSVGGVPEVVEHGATGLLAKVGNADDIAEAILLLSRNDSLQKRLASAAQESAAEQFSENSMIARYDELFREMQSVPK